MEIKNKVFFVTGGGNGIAREVVLQLLKNDAKVFTIDKNEKGLAETKSLTGDYSKNLEVLACDVTNKEQIQSLPEKVIEKFGQIDGVLNIAGIIQPFVKINDIPYEKIDLVMNVNFFGTLYVVKSFLPYLLKNSSTSIIANVSSMGGFLPVPGQCIYGASKAAVKLMTEGLYAELKNTNVRVSTILPGAINTNITKNSGVEIKTASADTKNFPMTSAEKAGNIIIKGIEKEKYKILIGKDCKFMDFLYRLNPKNAVDMITKQMKSLLK